MPSARAMSLMPTGGAGAVGFRASEDMRKPYYLTSDDVACVRRSPRRHSVRLAAAGRTGRPGDDSGRRLRPPGADEAGLGLLRLRRTELHLYEGRPEAPVGGGRTEP